jgi:hypothetical protein
MKFFGACLLGLTYRVVLGCVGSGRKKSWPLLADYLTKLAHDLWRRLNMDKFG